MLSAPTPTAARRRWRSTRSYQGLLKVAAQRRARGRADRPRRRRHLAGRDRGRQAGRRAGHLALEAGHGLAEQPGRLPAPCAPEPADRRPSCWRSKATAPATCRRSTARQLSTRNADRQRQLRMAHRRRGGRAGAAAGSPLLPHGLAAAAAGSPLLPLGSPLLPVNHMPLSTWGLGAALKAALDAGVPKLSVIHFDNCFNMSVEVLHTVAPYADYATGYPNYNFFTAGEPYPGVFEQAGASRARRARRTSRTGSPRATTRCSRPRATTRRWAAWCGCRACTRSPNASTTWPTRCSPRCAAPPRRRPRQAVVQQHPQRDHAGAAVRHRGRASRSRRPTQLTDLYSLASALLELRLPAAPGAPGLPGAAGRAQGHQGLRRDRPALGGGRHRASPGTSARPSWR